MFYVNAIIAYAAPPTPLLLGTDRLPGELVRESDQAESLVHILFHSRPPAQRSRIRRCYLQHLQFRATPTE
jgi:hypothetical protein